MFSSLRLARARSQSSTTSCAGGGDKEAAVNGDADKHDKHDKHGDRHVERHVYQVTPTPTPQGLSSCPTSPLLSGKPPKTPKTSRSLVRRGSSKWGLDKALCPSIGSLRDRVASRWDDDDPLGRPGRGSRGSQSDVCTCSKVTRVAVTREDGCLGITVRGGAPAALVITSVHPGGPADREGSIRPGDRLLAVDGTNLQLADLSTAHSVLRGHGKVHAKVHGRPNGRAGGHHGLGHRDSAVAELTIEYSVCVVGAVVGAQGPLLVELARPPAHQLGLTLRTERGSGGRTAVIVDDIKAASVADRSGALHRGDQILAVDDLRVDCTDLTANDVVSLLGGRAGERGEGASVLRVEILPAHCRHPGLPGTPQQYGSSHGVHQRSPCPSESGLSAYNALRTLRGYDNGSLASSTGGSGSAGLVSHVETLAVLLRAEPLSGYGLAVRASGASRTPTVSALHPDGPAERSGCLQVGDRIVAVDDREVDAEQLALLLDNPGPPLSLRVSFPVAESVVPASGVFTVKLAKCRPGLGITITGNKTGEYLYISDIKCGSVAHRSGTLAVGDRILEIDGLSLSVNATGRDLGRALDHAARILHNSGDVVTLKVLKDEVPAGYSWGGWGGPPLRSGWASNAFNWSRTIEYPMEGQYAASSVEYSSDFPVEYPVEYSVEYTVELVRHGGSLGLTIAGSEDPADSVTISGLTPGGLAEQTGALHIGDRLLAINGESLRGRRLSEAIAMFQNSADVVTLKIARARNGTAAGHQQQRPAAERAEHKGDHSDLGGRLGGRLGPPHPGIPSVDSAVESWDSSASQRNASPAGTPMSPLSPLPPPGFGSPLGAGQAGTLGQPGRVKLTPLPPTVAPATTPGPPLSRRAGSCPSLDCLLQQETAGRGWDGEDGDESLEDLDSAAATAATLSLRAAANDPGKAGVAAEAKTPTTPPSPISVSPPASFRQGGQGLAGPWPSSSQSPLWPRPPPSPSPGGGRLTAAKALSNDWQQRLRQQQQSGDIVDNAAAADSKLSSFQWASNDATLRRRGEPPSPPGRGLDDFAELNNNLLREPVPMPGPSGPSPGRFLFDEHDQPHAANAKRASSLLLEEAAVDALRLQDLGLHHPMELYQVTIYKDSVYEDFGFSVSDGLYERGVFINRIRKGGPADATGVLQPYDRILQVNETRTHDFDCCLTVPLIAAAGDRIQLIVARHQDTSYQLPLDESYLDSNTVTQTI
ncbi:glutamate receptor-interacting protein 2 [Thrips palmi]|uniref:Glutamate receptor-interacting protein 2 n=1 Tax=Thrips palmi TaxID=161013 RepID=A0A6P8YZA0_THRPL|nr:glutamate receptor-interacting protein 2 [Thrips palmi]